MARRFSWAQTAMLGWEAAQVIGLRLGKIARGGPAAQTESARMVSEKVTASASAFSTLMTGGGLGQVIAGFRKKVRANRKRLK